MGDVFRALSTYIYIRQVGKSLFEATWTQSTLVDDENDDISWVRRPVAFGSCKRFKELFDKMPEDNRYVDNRYSQHEQDEQQQQQQQQILQAVKKLVRVRLGDESFLILLTKTMKLVMCSPDVPKALFQKPNALIY